MPFNSNTDRPISDYQPVYEEMIMTNSASTFSDIEISGSSLTAGETISRYSSWTEQHFNNPSEGSEEKGLIIKAGPLKKEKRKLVTAKWVFLEIIERNNIPFDVALVFYKKLNNFEPDGKTKTALLKKTGGIK